jgi:hypothetical protein
MAPTRLPLPQPVGQPMPQRRTGPQRRWYAEPAVIGTAILLALVVVAFVVLLSTTFG